MEISEAIRTRRSIRSYKPDPVPRKVLEEVVKTAQWAPSPANGQPWEFAILGGKVMEELRKLLYEKRAAGVPPELEFRPDEMSSTHVPEELKFPPPSDIPEAYDKRRTEHRALLNSYLYPPGTENVKEEKGAYYLRGARLLNAPNIIIVYTDKVFLDVPWVIVGMGIMMQTVCLAALSHGLGTCIMGGAVDWPDMLRELLGIPQSKVILNGITIGYPDFEAKVNNTPRTRMPLDDWVHWHGL